MLGLGVSGWKARLAGGRGAAGIPKTRTIFRRKQSQNRLTDAKRSYVFLGEAEDE